MKKIGIFAVILGALVSGSSVVSAQYIVSSATSACNTQITSNLQKGMEGSQVYNLQNLLTEGRYLYASPNGYFGGQTEQAVRSFQRSYGLPASGYVGEATRLALMESVCNMSVSSLSSYNTGGGITYVQPEDPFVNVVNTSSFASSIPSTPTLAPTPAYNSFYPTVDQLSPAAVTVPEIQSTNIVYSPSIGYTYGIVPASGSVTVTSPSANMTYREGDTVSVNWYTNNLTASTYTILLENTISGQSQTVGVTSANSYSFSLTRELLNAVCAGGCNYGNQSSYRVVVSTPVKDIAGTVSNLRAAVQPVTIIRQFIFDGTVSITANKSPVNSGELFKLYLNIPRGASWDTYSAGNYSIKIRATCPTSVTVSIAGTSCGQEFVIPFAPVSFQQEIPVTVTNPTWYRQNVTFELTVTNVLGQVIGTSQVNVIANGSPFSW